MAPAGSSLGSLLAIAMPLMMILTAFRALIEAARRKGGRVTTPALVLVFLGALSSAMAFWWNDRVLSKPASFDAWGGGLLPWLALDYLLWLLLWSALAAATIRLARRKGEVP
ncbi:hypothetical protein ACFOHK_02350 [Falsigemmobacter intermedius]|uniref:Uncharacterized protein n=1 Tax=Falsigemmobacter intermedius TaxID=1553448 RepID=A0A3S3UEZ9_9RHOB|nr:hypothetical protein [Falsigemmobacter intermedius]RWY42470.1 hypothetical protein EP867_06980 [Falsigemmobacter intermedius]